MSLRARIAITASVAVLVAVLAASMVLYLTMATALRGSVDEGLERLADGVQRSEIAGDRFRMLAPAPRVLWQNGALGYVQPLGPQGQPLTSDGSVTLPVSDRTVAVARGEESRVLETVDVQGEPVRVLTVRLDAGGAVQLARPIAEIEATLDALRTRLGAGVVGGVMLAAGLGALVARRAIAPVHDLTELVEDVSATQDLTRRIEVPPTNDEIGRLAQRFNEMLATLEQARRAQQQLVADASHELRTPLTSLRTNIEVLCITDTLSEEDRSALTGDVVGQLEEFGRLVDGLVDLARGEAPARDVVEVRLDRLVHDVARRTQTFAPGQAINLDATPTVVHGDEHRLERAVTNLLDNAVKYGGGKPVDVRVSGGCLEVRDHGPGIDEEHLEYIFDRFYRAPEARSAPGSGLGLSIVRQVAGAHDGSVSAANAADGGMVFTLELPDVPVNPEAG